MIVKCCHLETNWLCVSILLLAVTYNWEINIYLCIYKYMYIYNIYNIYNILYVYNIYNIYNILYVYIYIYIHIQSWIMKQCALPVVTKMALWQLMHLGTRCAYMMCLRENRTSCGQMQELRQSHCRDSRQGTLFSWLHVYFAHRPIFHLAPVRFICIIKNQKTTINYQNAFRIA